MKTNYSMEKLSILIDFDTAIVCGQNTLRFRKNAAKALREFVKDGHAVRISTTRDPLQVYSAIDKLDVDISGMIVRDIHPVSRFDLVITGNGQPVDWSFELNKVKRMATNKPFVVAIVGESASGKTTLARELEVDMGIPELPSYTDRPRRGETDDSHIFLTKEEFDELSDFLAYTEYGGYRYCTLRSDLMPTNTYVVDENGFKMLSKDDSLQVYSVRLKLDESIRLIRSKGDKERIARDSGRYNIPHHKFDCVIDTGVVGWRENAAEAIAMAMELYVL